MCNFGTLRDWNALGRSEMVHGSIELDLEFQGFNVLILFYCIVLYY